MEKYRLNGLAHRATLGWTYPLANGVNLLKTSAALGLKGVEKYERTALVNTPSGTMAQRLGFEPGFLILECGYGNDCDESLRQEIIGLTGNQFINGHAQEVVDAVLLWWRDDGSDLVDELVDALAYLTDGGPIWVVTPKVGRPNHVEPSDIQDAAPTAGLSQTSSFSVGFDWSATRLVTRKPA